MPSAYRQNPDLALWSVLPSQVVFPDGSVSIGKKPGTEYTITGSTEAALPSRTFIVWSNPPPLDRPGMEGLNFLRLASLGAVALNAAVSAGLTYFAYSGSFGDPYPASWLYSTNPLIAQGVFILLLAVLGVYSAVMLNVMGLTTYVAGSAAMFFTVSWRLYSWWQLPVFGIQALCVLVVMYMRDQFTPSWYSTVR